VVGGAVGGVVPTACGRGRRVLTDRLSIFSSRSATLLSMRKISISSWENIWATVLHVGDGSALQFLSRFAIRALRCFLPLDRGKTHDCGRRALGFHSRSSSSSLSVMAAAVGVLIGDARGLDWARLVCCEVGRRLRKSKLGRWS
jgi:hypothetical protein